jgi:hypothetical protein
MIQQQHIKPASTIGLCLYIGQDRLRRWVVRDAQGLCGGLFTNQAEAIRFAMYECQSPVCRHGAERPRAGWRSSTAHAGSAICLVKKLGWQRGFWSEHRESLVTCSGAWRLSRRPSTPVGSVVGPRLLADDWRGSGLLF